MAFLLSATVYDKFLKNNCLLFLHQRLNKSLTISGLSWVFPTNNSHNNNNNCDIILPPSIL